MKSIRFPLHDLCEIKRGHYKCPRCKSIGTWNPHGGLIDHGRDLRRVRRWVCKWCGLYYGPEGWQEAVMDMTVSHESIGLPGGGHGVWQLVKDAAPGQKSPKAWIEGLAGGPVNPWRF